MAVNRYYSAVAQDTTLTSGISSSATSFTVAGTTGFPSTPFVLALDYDTALEELVTVTNVAGLTLTVSRADAGRGSGTVGAPVAHAVGAVIRHVITAQDMTEAQAHIAATGPVHGITASAAAFLANPTSANLITAVSDETGSGSLVFGTAPTIGSPIITTPKTTLGFNAQTGTTYTLVATDQDKLVTLSNTSAITLTIPSGVFSAGQYVNVQQIGTGLVVIQGDGTSTITSTGGNPALPKLSNQYSAATIICTGTNTFTVIGGVS
jgi:hypothetical protein